MKNEQKVKVKPYHFTSFKKIFKNDFKNFKRLGLPVSTTQAAQDATQVAQDVGNKFKKMFEKRAKSEGKHLTILVDFWLQHF